MKVELEETLRHLKGAPIRAPNRHRSRGPGWDTKPTALLCRLLMYFTIMVITKFIFQKILFYMGLRMVGVHNFVKLLGQISR